MYHFDYVCKQGGTVFEGIEGSYMVNVNGKIKFSFKNFLSTFVLIENYRHPFTITTSAKRKRRLDVELGRIGYTPVILKQIDYDFDDENAFLYGYYSVGSTNPFTR